MACAALCLYKDGSYQWKSRQVNLSEELNFMQSHVPSRDEIIVNGTKIAAFGRDDGYMRSIGVNTLAEVLLKKLGFSIPEVGIQGTVVITQDNDDEDEINSEEEDNDYDDTSGWYSLPVFPDNVKSDLDIWVRDAQREYNLEEIE